MTYNYRTHQKAICDNILDNIPVYAVLHTVVPHKKIGNSLDCKNHGGPASRRTYAKPSSLLTTGSAFLISHMALACRKLSSQYEMTTIAGK